MIASRSGTGTGTPGAACRYRKTGVDDATDNGSSGGGPQGGGRRRLGTRLAAATGFALLLIAAVAYAATTVQITKPNGKTTPVDIADQDKQDYEVEDVGTVQGVSLVDVLKSKNVARKDWTSVTVAVGDESPLTVAKSDYDEYPGDQVPVFYDENGQVTFAVPETDDDDADRLTSTLVDDMEARAFGLAEIKVSPASAKIDPGEKVSFTSKLKGDIAGDPDDVKYSWSAQGGSTGKGPDARLSFPEKTGRYSVSVTGTNDGQVVAAGAATVTVGDPDEPPEEGDGGGGTGAPAGGGFGGGGGIPGSSFPPSSFGPGSTLPDDFGGQGIPDNAFPGGELPDDFGRGDELPAAPGVQINGELMSAAAAVAPETPQEASPSASEGVVVEENHFTLPGAVLAAGIVIGLMGLGASREYGGFGRLRDLAAKLPLGRLRRLLPG